jgi:hypothetical protein
MEMDLINTETIVKMQRCLHLLEPPADQVVQDCLDEIKRLREALDRIYRPIWWMQEDQKRLTGNINIDGAAAINIASSVQYYKDIAERTLLSNELI